MKLIIDSCIDALIDCAKLLPFLMITYLLMEWLEKKTEEKKTEKIQSAGPLAPLAGGILGAVPQCGFSCVAANMYSGGIITVGVLLAVFMSTSDEMLPIFISHTVNIVTILKILVVKMLIAAITGYAVDLLNRSFKKKKTESSYHSHDGHSGHDNEKHVHDLCEQEHCNCKDGIWVSALKHTVKIAIFIIIITFFINIIMGIAGEDSIKSIFNETPVVGEALAALVGLIPNCAASIIITELYLDGVLGAGAMMSGLLVSAGVGMLVLFRMNRHHVKENIKVLVTLYVCSLFWGLLISLTGITF